MGISKKKVIRTSQLRPGMVFTAPVFIDENNVLIHAHEPLRKGDLDKLLKWGIEKVYTDGELIAEQKDNQQEKIALEDAETLKLHKDYNKSREFRQEFQKRLGEIAAKLRKNFRLLMDKKQFNNNELLSEALFLANVILEHRFFPVMMTGYRSSDDLIVNHSLHAACYAGYLAKLINLGKAKIQEILFATMIMDIGMYFIPAQLRQKNYPLNEEEKKVFYNHTIYGFKVLTQEAFVKKNLAIAALQHHENFDGTGYPRKSKGEEISLLARIAAIVDRYTAMLEDRYHRKARIPYEAMKILLSQEVSHLDPRLLRFFVGGLSIYPVGSYVLLSNGWKGIVVEGNMNAPLRPLIKLAFDENGKTLQDTKFLNLSKMNNLTIMQALDPAEQGIDLITLI